MRLTREIGHSFMYSLLEDLITLPLLNTISEFIFWRDFLLKLYSPGHGLKISTLPEYRLPEVRLLEHPLT